MRYGVIWVWGFMCADALCYAGLTEPSWERFGWVMLSWVPVYIYKRLDEAGKIR